MKKLLSLLVVALLSVSLVACAGKKEEAAAGKYKAGTYSQVVKGNNGDIKVDGTCTDAAITEVKIVEHAETPGLSDGAIEKVPAAIIEKQSTEVDTIAGATVTSKAIIEAVNAAITEATK